MPKQETGLTVTEQNTLSACETDIERGGRLVAEAMTLIRDKRLYRQYGTFETYCKERWNITPRHVNRIFQHEKVLENLSEMGPMGPKIPERATREIADLPADKQVEVVKEAAKNGKNPTAKAVKEAREKVAPKPRTDGKISGGTKFDVAEIEAAGGEGQASEAVAPQDAPAASSKKNGVERNPAPIVDRIMRYHLSPLAREIDEVAETLGWKPKTKRTGNHGKANTDLNNLISRLKAMRGGEL